MRSALLALSAINSAGRCRAPELRRTNNGRAVVALRPADKLY